MKEMFEKYPDVVTPEQVAEFQALMGPIYEEYGAGYEDLIQEIINTGL